MATRLTREHYRRGRRHDTSNGNAIRVPVDLLCPANRYCALWSLIVTLVQASWLGTLYKTLTRIIASTPGGFITRAEPIVQTRRVRASGDEVIRRDQTLGGRIKGHVHRDVNSDSGREGHCCRPVVLAPKLVHYSCNAYLRTDSISGYQLVSVLWNNRTQKTVLSRAKWTSGKKVFFFFALSCIVYNMKPN